MRKYHWQGHKEDLEEALESGYLYKVMYEEEWCGIIALTEMAYEEFKALYVKALLIPGPCSLIASSCFKGL